MLKKIAVGGVAVALGFLLVTNPIIADAAGQITGAQIKNGSVTTKDVKNNNLKGKDIKNGSIKSADLADSYALADQGDYTPVTLGAGFTAFGGGYSTPGFRIDTLGFVHLKGTMNCPGSGTAFVLPVGARPEETMVFPLAVGSIGAGNVQVLTSGSVTTFHPDGNPHPCGLDGIIFPLDSVSGSPRLAKQPARVFNN